MKGVGAALGYQGDLCARPLSLVCAVIGGGDSEFLNRILSHGKHRGEGISIGLVVDIDAVECDVALIAARSIDGAIARVLVFVADAIAGVRDSSLQAQ